MSNISLVPVKPGDREWISEFITRRWGTTLVVAHGVIYYPHILPGFIALQDEERVGLVTYHINGNNCEIVSIDSTQPARGIGTALIEAVKEVAYQAECRRLWLTTTNDNLNALRFYQKRGFVLVTIHRNAIEISRKLKPQIGSVSFAKGWVLRSSIFTLNPVSRKTVPLEKDTLPTNPPDWRRWHSLTR